MASKPHATTEEQTAALGNVRREPTQIDLLSGELVSRRPKAGRGDHIRLKPLGIERPAVPGMASWAGGGPEGKRCKDCVYLGAVTVQRPNFELERSSAACLRYVQRTGRLPAVRSDIAYCNACDQFKADEAPQLVHAWLIEADGTTDTPDWIDHKGIGRFHSLDEREDPERPGRFAPPARR